MCSQYIFNRLIGKGQGGGGGGGGGGIIEQKKGEIMKTETIVQKE